MATIDDNGFDRAAQQRELDRVIRRGRLIYRMQAAARWGARVGGVGAGVAFLAVLLRGVGTPGIPAAPILLAGLAGLVALAAIVAAFTRPDDDVVVRQMDRDYGLMGAINSARELLARRRALTPLAAIHVRRTLADARRLGLARTLPAAMGYHARILGILCVCILSVSLI